MADGRICRYRWPTHRTGFSVEAAMSSKFPQMDWSGADQAENLSPYRQAMEYFFLDEGLADKQKQAIKIIRGLGNEGLRRLKSCPISELDKQNPEKLWSFLGAGLKVEVNFHVYRKYLGGYSQGVHESLDEFVTGVGFWHRNVTVKRQSFMECRWHFYSGITDIFKYLKISLILLQISAILLQMY